jgi:HAMP domain-containing protein
MGDFFNRLLKNLDLGKKFNLLMLMVFLGGISLSGLAFATILNQRAMNEVTSQAMILLTTMNSVRHYTNVEVNPLLKPMLDKEFLPESVPAYSAREVFEQFRTTPAYDQFFYTEATLNPTNIRDRADAKDEVPLIRQFQQDTNLKELRGFRDTAAGKLFYIARPIKIEKESCLVCHSRPEAAPKSLIERYGDKNGFGWKLNDIVGAQIITVPATEVVNTAQQSFLGLMGIVVVILAATTFAMNWLLRQFVIRPIQHLSEVAAQVSMGEMNAEFKPMGKDEVGELAAAFSRMKVSLAVAMRMLDQEHQDPNITRS